MAVIYRRLTRVVFQTAALSTSKWAWSKRYVQLGRSCLFKSAKASAGSKDADQNKLDHQESPVAYSTTTSTSQITDNRKGIEENDGRYLDNGYPINVFESPTKTCATRSQFLGKDRPTGLNPDRVGKPSTPNKRLYAAIETYCTKLDPRAFQQHRPEYKSMCFNVKPPMATTVQEGELILQNVTSSLTHSEISEYLEKLSCLPKNSLVLIKSFEKLHMLYRYSTAKLPLYTNSEIISILGAFVRLGTSPSHPMLKDYEQEFCLRVWHLSTNELLLVADTFRCMSFQVPKFLDIMYSCMELRCLDLKLHQVIQLIYIFGEGRHAPQELLEKIEAMVLRYLTSINLEEIGTVCLGFFKVSSGLSKHLMERFGDLIAENIEQISNYAMVSVLKMFRFTRVDHMQFFSRVGQVAHKRVPEMRIQAIMHVVLAFAAMHILNKDLMDAVALAIPDRLSYCRSKDLAKFLWSFGVLKYEPPNADVFYSAFINQIRENLEEFEKFPEHFISCLLGLAFCEQFPFDLISIALSENLALHSTKISILHFKKDLFTLAGTVEIECPQYTGNTISTEFRKDVTDWLVELSTRDIHMKEEIIEAGQLLQHVLGGSQYVKEHMILPHTRSKDFEVHLDVNRKPIAINSVEELEQPLVNRYNVKITDDLISQLTNISTLMPTSSENANIVGDRSMTACPRKNNENPFRQSEVLKLAIQVTNRNQYLYNSKQLLGLHVLKRRQLRKLGYVVVELPYWEWFPLVKRTQSEKLAYLHHKVFSSVLG